MLFNGGYWSFCNQHLNLCKTYKTETHYRTSHVRPCDTKMSFAEDINNLKNLILAIVEFDLSIFGLLTYCIS